MTDAPSSIKLTHNDPATTAHINLLQGIINRLANTSASCKTWCLSIVAALLSLAGSTHNPNLITVALVPVMVFGFIDMMYLAHETAYRELYKDTLGISARANTRS